MNPRHIHLIGIGGIGLSAIARILLARGDIVTGSDIQSSPITEELARLGAKVFIGHRAENLGQADLVLVTSAAPVDNPEVIEAQRRNIPIKKRNDFFPELTRGKKTIAVAGTNGKTTTTAMIATILTGAGLDPSAIIGGIIPELNGNARAGGGEYLIVEADEYDRAFLGLRPTIAVVTSIELDHPDIYPDLDAVAEAFRQFMQLVPADGLIVGCGDGERVSQELNGLRDKYIIKYGLGAGNQWQATEVHPTSRGGSRFVARNNGVPFGEIELAVPGKHNIQNALAALVVANAVGVPVTEARLALASFHGALRRFEVKGEFGGVVVVDDYAHNPSKIRATLAAARERYPEKEMWVVFQPHTFSRTIALLNEFAKAFDDADHVVVTEVYGARERDSHGVSGRQIVEKMSHRDARFIPTLEASADFVAAQLRPGDVLLTLGAGDVYRVGNQVADTLQRGRDV